VNRGHLARVDDALFDNRAVDSLNDREKRFGVDRVGRNLAVRDLAPRARKLDRLRAVLGYVAIGVELGTFSEFGEKRA
jgi:hypothetical protein